KLLDQELKVCRQKLADAPDSVSAAIQMLQLLQTQVSVHTAADGQERVASSAAFLEFATQQAQKHSAQPEVLLAYINAHGQAISRISRSEPLQAEAQLKQVQKLLGGIVSDDAKLARVLETGKRMVASVSRRIVSAKMHLELIGKPAAPLDAIAWVNGPSLNDNDLEGKVVLLDFWAVWCGPCVATFPHLREWHEKYSDKGLVIIGVTRYYNYEWNQQTGKPRRGQSNVSPGDEQAMLGKFAEQHKLQHRFMITPKASNFQRRFGVTGIPQAVVLDRDGTMQMIRVGSGDQNAQDIERKIQQLLDEPATAGE
ncbi:MAG: TlpA disulfide reductase family protein, partial [Planctomycetaceae bacterium]